MTAAAPNASRSAAEPRHDRLVARVRGLRTRAGGGDLDRWLLVLGALLMPAGFAVVLLGWAGASGTPLVFEQVPYLISGGLLGLALVVGGGFVYFTYWQSVRVREARRQHDEVVGALRRVEALLSAAGTPGTGGTAYADPARLVVTGTGTMAHRGSCPVVAGRAGLRAVTPAEAAGLRPCRICEPLRDG